MTEVLRFWGSRANQPQWSIGTFQTLEMLLETLGLLASEGKKFEAVMVSAPVPKDCPYVPSLRRFAQRKFQRGDLAASQLRRDQYADACLREVLAMGVQILIGTSRKQGHDDLKT
jgi:hypothetical protein